MFRAGSRPSRRDQRQDPRQRRATLEHFLLVPGTAPWHFSRRGSYGAVLLAPGWLHHAVLLALVREGLLDLARVIKLLVELVKVVQDILLVSRVEIGNGIVDGG